MWVNECFVACQLLVEEGNAQLWPIRNDKGQKSPFGKLCHFPHHCAPLFPETSTYVLRFHFMYLRKHQTLCENKMIDWSSAITIIYCISYSCKIKLLTAICSKINDIFHVESWEYIARLILGFGNTNTVLYPHILGLLSLIIFFWKGSVITTTQV